MSEVSFVSASKVHIKAVGFTVLAHPPTKDLSSLYTLRLLSTESRK
jgi:hypothetical protein